VYTALVMQFNVGLLESELMGEEEKTPTSQASTDKLNSPASINKVSEDILTKILTDTKKPFSFATVCTRWNNLLWNKDSGILWAKYKERFARVTEPTKKTLGLNFDIRPNNKTIRKSLETLAKADKLIANSDILQLLDHDIQLFLGKGSTNTKIDAGVRLLIFDRLLTDESHRDERAKVVNKLITCRSQKDRDYPGEDIHLLNALYQQIGAEVVDEKSESNSNLNVYSK